jgi:flagellar hook assembly protein FlgD
MANFATSPAAQMYSSTYAPPYTLAVAPNPSNAAATLTLTLLTPLDIDVSSVNAGIYDALGRCVHMIPPSILASWLKQGQISILWNGDDDAGRDVAPGAYFLVVQTPSARQAVKILRW